MRTLDLESAFRDAPWERWIAGDPVAFVRRFTDPRDQEIAGLVAAALAYGRIGSIMPSVNRVLAAMDWEPYRFVTECDPECEAERFADCTHRFHTPRALIATLVAVGRAIRRHGSLCELFLAGYRESDADIRPALTRFVNELRMLTADGAGAWLDEKDLYGWRHFLASPEDGSACKRLNLYLRWMVRSGTPDVGAWPGVSPAKLLIPVDVHVARIARALHWTSRASADMAMSLEITAVLRKLDPVDPVRFDFVISHLGMDTPEFLVSSSEFRVPRPETRN
jgi:uncharacterized protein (TIGR02757 family)